MELLPSLSPAGVDVVELLEIIGATTLNKFILINFTFYFAIFSTFFQIRFLAIETHNSIVLLWNKFIIFTVVIAFILTI